MRVGMARARSRCRSRWMSPDQAQAAQNWHGHQTAPVRARPGEHAIVLAAADGAGQRADRRRTPAARRTPCALGGPGSPSTASRRLGRCPPPGTATASGPGRTGRGDRGGDLGATWAGRDLDPRRDRHSAWPSRPSPSPPRRSGGSWPRPRPETVQGPRLAQPPRRPGVLGPRRRHLRAVIQPPPPGAVVLSIDEKTAIAARSRKHPDYPGPHRAGPPGGSSNTNATAPPA